jgi:cardiolipin synthase
LRPAWINLPNLLTLARLLLAAPIVIAIVAGRAGEALALVVAAGVTDVLDGAAARRLGVVTQVGAYLDPIADKILMSSVFLALLWAESIPLWFVVLVFARDALILLMAAVFLAFTSLRRFPPSRLGKLSTFFQIGCAVTWLVRNAWPSAAMHGLAQLALGLSAAFTLASGVDYAFRAIRMGRQP